MSEIQPQRGEIWWAELDPTVGREQSGRRPVIVVSSNDFLETGAERAAIVPVTTKYRDLPSWIPLNQTQEIKKPSWALPDQIRTIDFSRLKKPAGRVDEITLRSIDTVLQLVLDL